MMLTTISLDDLLSRMPLLADLRPDLLPEKIAQAMLQASIKIAERTGVLERTYDIDLQCCTGEYLLDECEERVVKLTQLCHTSTTGGQSASKFAMANQGFCAIPGCGGSQIRYVPSRTLIEISGSSGLTGVLKVTATVAPKFDASEIDEVFSELYRNALYHETAGAIMRFAGEHNNSNYAVHHERLAEQEIGRITTNKHTGYKNTTKRMSARRFV
jgi:hypothetical protein